MPKGKAHRVIHDLRSVASGYPPAPRATTPFSRGQAKHPLIVLNTR
jgi:hypothetical protein